jgi:hypothetical protein
MNIIKAVNRTSKYCNSPHLVITLDGNPLDEIIYAATQDDLNLGLISALDRCFSNPADSELAWNRILPQDGQTSVAPILVCPDDLDFHCTVVVALVTATPETIQWSKLGFDLSLERPTSDPDSPTIQWLSNVGPFKVLKADYLSFLSDCKKHQTDWWSPPA